MGTIVSPPNGANVYKGAIVPISYRSDTVDFDCGVLSKICTVRYKLDGNYVGGFINVSQTGAAPQTQAPENITMPTTGASATVDAEGWGVGGQRNDSATATYNLIDPPTATCNAASLVTATTAQINATIAGTLLAGGSARFVWGTPTPNTNAAAGYAAGAVFAGLTGLTANTTYAYRLEILDAFGNVVAQSAQCTFTTSAAATPSATCAAATAVTSSAATLNGTLANIPAGGFAQFWVTGIGAIATNTYANGAVTGSATGLTANTTYTYRLEIFDASNTVVAQSGNCTVTTSAAATPTATCTGATDITSVQVTLNGTLANIPAGGQARFWIDGVGGQVVTYTNGAKAAAIAGLTPNTAYTYHLEILDVPNTGNVVAQSPDCAFTTLAAPGTPTTVEAQLVKLCSITGVTLLRDCDTNEPILLVHVATSDGDVIPVTSTEFPAGAGAGVFSVMGFYRSYYASTDGAYLSPQPTNICLPSSAGKIEIVCRCDDTDGDGVGDISYKEIVKIDDAGTVTLLATYNRTMTAPYTPVSPIDCSVPGDNLVAVEPHYKVLTGAQTWSVAADATLPVTSVTVMVIAAGTVAPTVTDAGGTYPLFAGQSVSWSTIYARDVAGLRAPLVFTCTAGSTLAVAWTEEVI